MARGWRTRMREWGGRRGRREGGRKERRQAVYFILLDTDGPRGTSAWRSKTVKRTSIRHAWWMTGLSHVLERWGIKLASRHPISTSRAPSRACVRLGGTYKAERMRDKWSKSSPSQGHSVGNLAASSFPSPAVKSMKTPPLCTSRRGTGKGCGCLVTSRDCTVT